jgi:hypothetical protein
MTVCGHHGRPVGVAMPHALSSSAALCADRAAVRMNTTRNRSARAIAAALFVLATPAMLIGLLWRLAVAGSPFVRSAVGAASPSAATERISSLAFGTCRSIADIGRACVRLGPALERTGASYIRQKRAQKSLQLKPFASVNEARSADDAARGHQGISSSRPQSPGFVALNCLKIPTGLGT